MPAKALLFLNRNAGARLPEGEREELLAALAAQSIEVLEISPELDCVREVREHAGRGTQLFIAAGGDGTIHHVLQGVVNTDAQLAVLPLGTYNHFAKDLGIPLDWREALDVAINGTTRVVDTGRVNDRFFVNNVSIGLYPELVKKREERGRDYPRWRARLYAFYSTLRKYPHVTLGIETETRHEVVRTHVFMVSNNPYELERFGIEAQRNTLSAGRLAVYWLEHTSRWRLTRIVARYAAGSVQAVPGFRSFRTVRMRVTSSRPHLHAGMDGEVFTLNTPLVITAIPQSLTVRVPVAKEEGKDEG